MRVQVLLILLLLVSNGYHLLHTPVPREGEAIFIDGRDYMPTARQLIDNAEESVLVANFEVKYYSSKPHSPSNLLIDSLAEARARGVDVKVVTDEYLNKYGDTADKSVRLLRSRGIDARLDDPETTAHAKFLVVDDRFVLIGSTNWTFYSLTKNDEANVLINSPNLAKDLRGYFHSLRS